MGWLTLLCEASTDTVVLGTHTPLFLAAPSPSFCSSFQPLFEILIYALASTSAERGQRDASLLPWQLGYNSSPTSQNLLGYGGFWQNLHSSYIFLSSLLGLRDLPGILNRSECSCCYLVQLCPAQTERGWCGTKDSGPKRPWMSHEPPWVFLGIT